MSTVRKRTKIVATLGPASEDVRTLTSMVRAGMDVARLNFSHGTHEHHALLMARVYQAARAAGRTVAILQDLSGPKLRVGVLPEVGVELVRGREVRLMTTRMAFSEDDHGVPQIPVPFRGLGKAVNIGTRLLLDDGRMELRVLSKGAAGVRCRVMQGGTLHAHKGLNIPEAAVAIPPITAKDRVDLLFGLRMGVDAVAISFVQSPDDIVQLRRLIASYERRERLRAVGDPLVKIFAKIEKPAAVACFDEILAEADGILVARGDLALEVGYEQVPVLQKEFVAKAVAASKPVIVATQMLDSMTERPSPTRAEVSDVANAVIDHADAVMLSQETAVGGFPVQTIETMREVIERTEASSLDDLVIAHSLAGPDAGHEASVAGVAGLLASLSGAKALLVASLSGGAARLVSHYRPELPILAIAEDPRTERQLCFSWGVTPVYLPNPSRSVEELVKHAETTVFRRGLVKKGARLVVVGRYPVGKSGPLNFVHLRGV